MEQVKKKWADVKSNTNKKETRNRALAVKTGGGPPPEHLEEWEDKVQSLTKKQTNNF